MCKRAMNANGLVKIQKLTKAKAEVCAAIEAQSLFLVLVTVRSYDRSYVQLSMYENVTSIT